MVADTALLDQHAALSDHHHVTSFKTRCPKASFEKGMEYNTRYGSMFGSARDPSCCNSISRASEAAKNAEAAIEKNWYMRHCSFMPFPLAPPKEGEPSVWDPIVNLIRRWTQGKDEESTEG
eukprot:GEMP01043242.1.p1 GENE.GEMP01043242.1~~GEMP01043242.1.p1  ORF type:complete len:121 (+),score=28.45 GEMP01043242.1:318-680(+)